MKKTLLDPWTNTTCRLTNDTRCVIKLINSRASGVLRFTITVGITIMPYFEQISATTFPTFYGKHSLILKQSQISSPLVSLSKRHDICDLYAQHIPFLLTNEITFDCRLNTDLRTMPCDLRSMHKSIAQVSPHPTMLTGCTVFQTKTVASLFLGLQIRQHPTLDHLLRCPIPKRIASALCPG